MACIPAERSPSRCALLRIFLTGHAQIRRHQYEAIYVRHISLENRKKKSVSILPKKASVSIVGEVLLWKFSSSYGNEACEYIENSISDLQWHVRLSDLHDSSIGILNLNVPYTISLE